VVSVLSGNRNFEGRINPDVKMNYLASPPLVVAYALAGTMDLDITPSPSGRGGRRAGPPRRPVALAAGDPGGRQPRRSPEMFTHEYGSVFEGDEAWRRCRPRRATPSPGTRLDLHPQAHVLRRHGGRARRRSRTSTGARVLAKLGDSVTTDHISPAGAIKLDSPAGEYLSRHGVERRDFNSYGSRRGNHEVMIRGTFANIRLRNQLAPGTEGGYTRDFTATAR
jgi:aconitate hydratase